MLVLVVVVLLLLVVVVVVVVLVVVVVIIPECSIRFVNRCYCNCFIRFDLRVLSTIDSGWFTVTISFGSTPECSILFGHGANGGHSWRTTRGQRRSVVFVPRGPWRSVRSQSCTP